MTNCSVDGYGNKLWRNSKEEFHRLDGPAIEHPNGAKFWYQYGSLHRLDGPAAEYFDGSKYWFYKGEWINCSSQEEFKRWLKLKVFL